MANGFVIGNRAPAAVQGTRFLADRTGALAVRARLLFVQGLGLLLQQHRERPFEKSLRGGLGQLFEFQEVTVESGASIPIRAPRDDSSPLMGEFTDIVEVLGW